MKMHRKVLFATTLGLSGIFLSACGSTATSNPTATSGHSINWNIELWGGNFVATSDGHCTQAQGSDNYSNGSPISLVGPDGAEISSATFSFGVLQKTTIDPSIVTNYPSQNICDFAVTFPNVPVVATYRVKTRDGQISPVSHVLSDLQKNSWSMGEVLGASFKQ